jgi:urate oxidase / 2-oxo-4-hydroxy-4-carboxy-5-ureidoimidazoline decarboxylase
MSRIRYGKHDIPFYRTHPTLGLFGGRVFVDVFGDNFMPAYTEGDNREVVATDTMKNFVHAVALDFSGDRHDGFALVLGQSFLSQYPQMSSLRVRVHEQPFHSHSAKLLSPLSNDYESVDLRIDRTGIRQLLGGRRNLRLVKLTGSAFREFARDEFTTLPDVKDRPLYIFLDVAWRFREPDLLGAGSLPRSRDVRDCVIQTFDDFTSMSIQHLVHEMGLRVLARFAELDEVSFEAQNRLWDTVKVSESDPTLRVFADPRPAHGSIYLSLRREAP